VRELPRVTKHPAVLLAAALVAAGCGGDGSGDGSSRSDDASAKQQVAGYFAAFNRGDGSAACALLTPEARAGVPSLSDRVESPDCEGAIRELSRVSEHLRSPRVTVEVTGERAVAKVRNRRPPYQSDVLLQKRAEGWRIAFPPALLERYTTPPGIPSELDGHGKQKSG
jgi:hypothetical protein